MVENLEWVEKVNILFFKRKLILIYCEKAGQGGEGGEGL